MGRSKWKGVFCDMNIVRSVFNIHLKGGPVQQKYPVRTQSRRSCVLPYFVGYKFEIHNGMDFVNVQISDEMVGHKFGEFAMTRKYPRYPEKVKGPVVAAKK